MDELDEGSTEPDEYAAIVDIDADGLDKVLMTNLLNVGVLDDIGDARTHAGDR